MLKRDRIIVLKAMPFSESDLIIRGLNTQGSQMSFIARGAKKSKKRFTGGVLEPLSFIEVEYRHSNSLHKIKEVWPLKDFDNLRKDYNRLELAFYFLKVIDTISQEGIDHSEEIFHLLGNALIQAESTKSIENLKLFFQVKVLYIQGVLPKNLYHQFILENTVENHEKLQMTDRQKHTFSKEVHQALDHYLSV